MTFPIGQLRCGLRRHRALLFKAVADRLGVPSRLVRGRYYCGSEDAAANVVVVGGSELFVDVMREPGAIYSPDNPAYAELHAPYVPKELTRAMERGLAGFSPSPVRVASPEAPVSGEGRRGSTRLVFLRRLNAEEPGSATTGSRRGWFAPRRAPISRRRRPRRRDWTTCASGEEPRDSAGPRRPSRIAATTTTTAPRRRLG